MKPIPETTDHYSDFVRRLVCLRLVRLLRFVLTVPNAETLLHEPASRGFSFPIRRIYNPQYTMPSNRSLGRNVHFYDATVPDVALGGLIQNGSVTEVNFLDYLWILLVLELLYMFERELQATS